VHWYDDSVLSLRQLRPLPILRLNVTLAQDDGATVLLRRSARQPAITAADAQPEPESKEI